MEFMAASELRGTKQRQVSNSEEAGRENKRSPERGATQRAKHQLPTRYFRVSSEVLACKTPAKFILSLQTPKEIIKKKKFEPSEPARTLEETLSH